MLEALVVIIVIGVLAAVVAPGLGAMDATRAGAAAGQTAGLLRYARASAAASGLPTGVAIDVPASTLTLVRVETAAGGLLGVPGPLGTDEPPVRLERLYSATIDSVTNGDGSETDEETIWFRFDGTPHTRTAAGVFDAFFAQDATIDLGAAGSVTVRAVTGVIE
jgi:type II secretory pathway pseudopilin PulG